MSYKWRKMELAVTREMGDIWRSVPFSLLIPDSDLYLLQWQVLQWTSLQNLLFLGNNLGIDSRSLNAGGMQYWHMFILETISSAVPFLMPLYCPFVHERWPSVGTLERCHWHLLTEVHVPGCSSIVWLWYCPKILDTNKQGDDLKDISSVSSTKQTNKKSCKPWLVQTDSPPVKSSFSFHAYTFIWQPCCETDELCTCSCVT